MSPKNSKRLVVGPRAAHRAELLVLPGPETTVFGV
jgi:hypothetical protein